MVTYYQSRSYKRLCNAHNAQTTSVLLAQASDDVKLKVSVLLNPPPPQLLHPGFNTECKV